MVARSRGMIEGQSPTMAETNKNATDPGNGFGCIFQRAESISSCWLLHVGLQLHITFFHVNVESQLKRTAKPRTLQHRFNRLQPLVQLEEQQIFHERFAFHADTIHPREAKCQDFGGKMLRNE